MCLAGLWQRKEYKPNKLKKMAKKEYEVKMVVECEEGGQNYIAQSVCDGLEEETCVKYIDTNFSSKKQSELIKGVIVSVCDDYLIDELSEEYKSFETDLYNAIKEKL